MQNKNDLGGIKKHTIIHKHQFMRLQNSQKLGNLQFLTHAADRIPTETTCNHPTKIRTQFKRPNENLQH